MSQAIEPGRMVILDVSELPEIPNWDRAVVTGLLHSRGIELKESQQIDSSFGKGDWINVDGPPIMTQQMRTLRDTHRSTERARLAKFHTIKKHIK